MKKYLNANIFFLEISLQYSSGEREEMGNGVEEKGVCEITREMTVF